jgi:hypothetical protein
MRWLAMSVALVACGDDPNVLPDAVPDAPISCLTPDAGYGAVTPVMQVAQFDTSMGQPSPDWYGLDATLDTFREQDHLFVELYEGLGAFSAGYPTAFPQTYSITGDELQFSTCGVCLRVFVDVDAQGAQTGNAYLATAGTVTLMSITPMLAGTVSNATFVRVAIDGESNSTPDSSGCMTSLGSLSFSATPMPL